MIVLYHFFWIVILVAYVIIILWIRHKWISHTYQTQALLQFPLITILVAARNEASCIVNLLESFKKVHYPSEKLEIILIDDQSEDATVSLIQQYKLDSWKLIQLDTSHGKKAALSKGVKESKGEIILCTDADCIVPPHWVNVFVAHFSNHPEVKMVTGLVKLTHNQSLLGKFQSIDVAGTMASTLAGISSGFYHSANGANLAFRKDAFDDLGGYGNDHLASGDDVFLIQKMNLHFPKGVSFIKHEDAIVQTDAEKDFETFFQQRKRWATKSKYYPQKGMVILQGIVWVFNILLVTSFLVSIIVGFPYAYIPILFLAFKMMVDYFFLRTILKFYKETDVLKSFIIVELLYIPYIIYMGLMALFPTKYMWKGRKVK